jgi:hypothetical protein
MAKKSSVERNKKRIRLADKYAAAQFGQVACAEPLWCDWSPTWLLQKIEHVPDLFERFGL